MGWRIVGLLFVCLLVVIVGMFFHMCALCVMEWVLLYGLCLCGVVSVCGAGVVVVCACVSCV